MVKPISKPGNVLKVAKGMDALRVRFAAEAEEGARKNKGARPPGTPKSLCPAYQKRIAVSPGFAVKCLPDCNLCRGFSWVWFDGTSPKTCPTSGEACAYPWCWACRNGNRPPFEMKLLRRIFDEGKRAAGDPSN